jgi:hypothetical protein
MTVADLIYDLFTLFNGVRIVSYLPQIVKIARDRNGATVISYVTWGSWTAANGSAGLYAAVNLGDPTLATLNLLNAGCCLIVIGLTAWQRRKGAFNCTELPLQS